MGLIGLVAFRVLVEFFGGLGILVELEGFRVSVLLSLEDLGGLDVRVGIEVELDFLGLMGLVWFLESKIGFFFFVMGLGIG